MRRGPPAAKVTGDRVSAASPEAGRPPARHRFARHDVTRIGRYVRRVVKLRRSAHSGLLARRANPVLAGAASALVMLALASGIGAIPGLGSVLNPGAGVWSAAAGALPVRSQAIDLEGMRAPANVSFARDGVPTVRASSDHDLYLVEGYLQAYFRLTQLDLERRTAEGRLAQLDGPSQVSSDTFELQTGLLRTAQATWAATPPGSVEAQALDAYSRGVNDRLAQLRSNGDWPSVFTLSGVYPPNWTPVDSLAIEGLLSQVLSYTTQPLDYALLDKSLGAARTQAFFPVVPADAQSPYDPGPYTYEGISPLPADGNADAATLPGVVASGQGVSSSVEGDAAEDPIAHGVSAAGTLISRIGTLPASQIHIFPDSNAWAVNGTAVANGTSMLAGDPHLQLSLPSFWYQLALSSPSTSDSGASLIGLPGIVVGRNRQISWSMTAVQNQSTLFYLEQTSRDHPHQYYWDGAWRDMQVLHYTIPVRGAAAVPLTVDLTVHGPVMTENGQTMSVTWMGNYPSQSLAAIIAVDKAQNYKQFRAALAAWHSPALNFIYADGHGNIGVVAAGYFPVVKSGQPWLPLQGTGQDDLAGVIPYSATPQVYNPPSHVLASANQRPVSSAYPYYIGTSLYFDNGYRADEIYSSLDGHGGLTSADFSALQDSVADYLSTLIVPKLTAALAGTALNSEQRMALDELTEWNHQMTVSSTGASIWWTFWTDYLSTVFQPWWNYAKVPASAYQSALQVSPDLTSLDEDLEAWTLHDGDNPAFSPPGKAGTASTAMRSSFALAVRNLNSKLGDDPSTWTWGRMHSVEIPSMSGTAGLGYGPYPAGGDPWTVDAADGGMDSSWGPSWRMVVDWTGSSSASAQAVYPGGQSDNPASPWYQNLVTVWWNGSLLPMPWVEGPPRSDVQWTLRVGE